MSAMIRRHSKYEVASSSFWKETLVAHYIKTEGGLGGYDSIGDRRSNISAK
jgi:hypothetical protein